MTSLSELTESDIARFWSKIDIRGDNDCWLWQSNPIATAAIFLQGSKIRAHRISYYLDTGIDPLNIAISRTCGIVGCVNPRHLATGLQGGGRSILTNDKVAQIRGLLKQGARPCVVARLFRVDSGIIFKIQGGSSWKKVQYELPYTGDGNPFPPKRITRVKFREQLRDRHRADREWEYEEAIRQGQDPYAHDFINAY